MAYRYACDRADRVAAIVSQAGAMWMDASRCQPSEPVAVLQIHGTEDQLVPYQGLARGVPAEYLLPSAHQSVADWVAFDKCNPRPDTSTPPLDLIEDEATPDVPAAETTVEKWTSCRGVELWTMRGGGHVPRIHHPSGARIIYNWLAAHPKP
jgi:polyhydroxybutyrate depolymerase